MYYKIKNWIYVDLSNPCKTMKQLKGVFIPLKLKFKISRKSWYPILWCSKPSFIHIRSNDVIWKDKWDTPRFENCPHIWIHLFGLNIIWYWTLESELDETDYWEQALWYLYYYSNISYGKLSGPDIQRARESWPWRNLDGTSNWNNKFLLDA